MSTIELGPLGVVINPDPTDAFVGTAQLADELGFSTIWLTGGPMESLNQVAATVRATSRAKIATGIIAVVRFSSAEVRSLYETLETEHPGRLVVGLGGAHGPEPMQTMNTFLDEIDPVVPQSRRVLAALGPKMFELAANRASGAFPVLVTAEFVRRAKALVGDDTTLAVEQLVVLESDPARARDIARRPLGFLGQMPAYQASFRRMGFSDADITGLSDHLVDSVVVWGDVDAIGQRVRELHASGADHIALGVQTGDDAQPTAQLRELSALLAD